MVVIDFENFGFNFDDDVKGSCLINLEWATHAKAVIMIENDAVVKNQVRNSTVQLFSKR